MDNPVAIVTGASRGIGRAVALNLANLGYDVALLARTEADLLQVSEEIETQFGVQSGVFSVDVSNKQQVDEVVASIAEAHNGIDLLFNNAGVFIPGTSEVTPEDMDRLINVNLRGAYNMVHAVVPFMKQQQSGYIFNLASRAGKISRPETGAYAMTKFGLVGFNEALFAELQPYNIKVTALCPSVVATDMSAFLETFPEEDKIQLDDIVNTVNYLLGLGDSAVVKDITILCKHLVDNPKAFKVK